MDTICPEQKLTNDNMILCVIWLRKCQACVHYGSNTGHISSKSVSHHSRKEIEQKAFVPHEMAFNNMEARGGAVMRSLGPIIRLRLWHCFMPAQKRAVIFTFTPAQARTLVIRLLTGIFITLQNVIVYNKQALKNGQTDIVEPLSVKMEEKH